MSSNDDEDKPTTYNTKGLKTETARLISRAHKKIPKIQNRYDVAQSQIESLLSRDDASTEELENCPNVSEIETDLAHWRSRLRKLNRLEEELRSVKGGKKVALPDSVTDLITELEVGDAPPARPPPKQKKVKGVPAQPRKPYRRYDSDGVEIRVGKQAEDNDELSINPEHRDGSDCWMHASGCAGSHVVIRCDNPSQNVIDDAAALAARQSKCNGGVIKVSLTKCRNVSKPPGAKAGLVMINGDVKIVKVNMKEVVKKLERLDGTVQIN